MTETAPQITDLYPSTITVEAVATFSSTTTTTTNSTTTVLTSTTTTIYPNGETSAIQPSPGFTPAASVVPARRQIRGQSEPALHPEEALLPSKSVQKASHTARSKTGNPYSTL